MILSDVTISNSVIAKKIKIQPWRQRYLQPASVDLTLGEKFLKDPGPRAQPPIDKGAPWRLQPLDLNDDISQDLEEWSDEGYGVMIKPQEFLLGATKEVIGIPDHIVARVEGKSSLARIGLLIHATAGYIDPGFEGNITLEFYNLGKQAIILRKDAPICQISFHSLTTSAKNPYGSPGLNSKYVEENAKGVVGSRYER